jgi:hypothetical protein
MNSIGAAKRSQFLLLPAEVALDLIDGRRDTGDAKQIAQLLGGEIADADRSSFA